MSFQPFRQIPMGGSKIGAQPFDIILTSTDGTTTQAMIAPGTVNGVFPSNWSVPQNISTSSTIYGYVVAQTNGVSVTSVQINFDSSYDPSQTPVNNGLPATFQYAFGIIINGVPYRTIGLGSIVAWGQVQYIKDKTTALQPGELPYQTFNTWVVAVESLSRSLFT